MHREHENINYFIIRKILQHVQVQPELNKAQSHQYTVFLWIVSDETILFWIVKCRKFKWLPQISMFYLINWFFVAKTIFKGGNYSREETICRNMVFKKENGFLNPYSRNPILKQMQFLTHLSISVLRIVGLECILQNVEKRHKARPFSFFGYPTHWLFICSANHNAQIREQMSGPEIS